MSKASKVSHFHSTTFSAHRGGRVDHATLGRPMATSSAASVPGTVGALTPKYKAQQQCIAFLSPSETVQQYANRIAGGDIQKVGERVFMYGGKGGNMKIADLAAKARQIMTGSSRGWGTITAGELFWAATGQKVPSGMPLGSCDLAPRASLDWYGTVHGVEDEPGTVGDLLDDAGDWVSTVVQESQNAFSNPDIGAGYQPPSANPGDNQTAAEQCAQMGPGWSWSADRNACANFEQEAAACAAAGNTWDDVAGQCRSNNCPPGSHSNPDLPGCIPDKIPCGAHSFQSGDKCLCEQGYEFKDMTTLDCVPVGQGWQSAIKKCGENTHTDPNVGGCVCDPGYIFDPKRTTADTLVCGKAECGSNSVFNQQDGQCHCKPGYDWVDPANIDNLDCKKVGGNGGGGPVTPPAPKCGPGTHVDSATNTCVVDETKQNEPTKEEDNTWKWVAGIAAAAVVVGGGTYLAMKKKGKKSALPNSSSHSTQTDVS
jgi:hypothetical protein